MADRLRIATFFDDQRSPGRDRETIYHNRAAKNVRRGGGALAPLILQRRRSPSRATPRSATGGRSAKTASRPTASSGMEWPRHIDQAGNGNEQARPIDCCTPMDSGGSSAWPRSRLHPAGLNNLKRSPPHYAYAVKLCQWAISLSLPPLNYKII